MARSRTRKVLFCPGVGLLLAGDFGVCFGDLLPLTFASFPAPSHRYFRMVPADERRGIVPLLLILLGAACVAWSGRRPR